MSELDILLTLAALVALYSTIVITPGKTSKILETLGKPHTYGRMPGLSFKLPWPLTRVVGKVDLQIRQVEKEVDAKTADNAFLSMPVTIQYKAADGADMAVKAYFELDNPEQQIVSYVLNIVRQQVPSMTMDEVFSNRDKIERAVEEQLTEKFLQYGYRIVNVLVDAPEPSDTMQEAYEKVLASQREKEAARNEAEAIKIRLVGQAAAEAESKKLQGEGIAQMRKAVADGMKEALDVFKSCGIDPATAETLMMEITRLDTLSSIGDRGNLIIADTKGDNKADLAQLIAAIKAAERTK